MFQVKKLLRFVLCVILIIAILPSPAMSAPAYFIIGDEAYSLTTAALVSSYMAQLKAGLGGGFFIYDNVDGVVINSVDFALSGVTYNQYLSLDSSTIDRSHYRGHVQIINSFDDQGSPNYGAYLPLQDDIKTIEAINATLNSAQMKSALEDHMLALLSVYPHPLDGYASTAYPNLKTRFEQLVADPPVDDASVAAVNAPDNTTAMRTALEENAADL